MKKPPINQDIIRERLVRAQKYIGKLETIVRSKSAEDLRINFDLQLESERSFEVLLQIIVDICTHIASSHFGEIPSSYAQCIDILAMKDVLSKHLAVEIAKAVKMRNLISHQYLDINYDIFYAAIKQIIIDFEDYTNSISLWLESQ